ncbi:MAG TPA: complex I subunit 5 family protein [Acidimicrobiales bacterium]|nr:complex I subunit 5 family protein [Acidimicrobiales bacterium]
MSSLPVFATFVPLTASAALGGFGGKSRRWVVDVFTLVAIATTLVFSAATFHQALGGRRVYWFSGWTPHNGVALGVSFAVDTFGAGAALLASVLATAAAVCSWRWLEAGNHHFQVLLLAFAGAMVGFAYSGDLFIMFVFFELMSVAAYALTGLKIDETAPLHGAINFAVLNSIGSFAMLLGIALIYGRTGALNFAQVGQAVTARGAQPEVVISMVLILTGMLVKSAVVPFHWWLADAHAVAPTPVCVLFSGIMVELALYGAARIYWSVFSGAVGPAQHGFGLVLVAAGVVSVLVGSIMAFAQEHLKRLLAFSTIAHAGIILIGVGLMSPESLAGSAVYVAGHGLVKASLFVLAGIVLHRFGSLDAAYLRGRGKEIKAVGVLFAIGALALAGLPPFGTDLGKSLIEEGATYPWLPWLTGLCGALTGGAVLRASGTIFLGLGPDDPPEKLEGRETRGPEMRETTSNFDQTLPTFLGAAVALLAAGLAVGLIPKVSDAAQRAAGVFVNRPGYAAAVLRGVAQPATVAAHATSASGTFYGLAAAVAAVALAGLALGRRRIPASLRNALRPALTPVHTLRAAHSGNITDAVMWFTVGVAAFGGLAIVTIRR